MDQNNTVYIVVDRVGAPYRVLLYQPSIRFILLTNSKVLSLQQEGPIENMVEVNIYYRGHRERTEIDVIGGQK